MRREDPDLKRYRDLMTPPEHFDEGFTWTAFAGALFVGLLIMPGSLYMGLLAGGSVGQAGTWVTMILFIEVAKRAHKAMNRAEMFILFYMAATVVSSPFGGLLWNQYFVQSKAVIGQGMSDLFPKWYAPTDPVVLASRNFFQVAWLPAIGLVLFQLLISRLDNNIIGYGLFKLASDVERLPFPMAPIGAQGIMALAEDLEESTGKKPGWRWRVFSIGGAIGMLFGFLYMGLPTITKAFFNRPIQMFPIPFVDWTGRTFKILPAVATGLSFDLGALVLGTVLPFWAMIGSFAGLVITFIVNPILYHAHVLHSWIPGDSTVETTFKNTVDFYFSYGLGISLAIAVIGLLTTLRGVRESRRRKAEGQQVVTIPKERGDIPFPVVGLAYLFSVTCYITVSGYLIGWHKGVMIVLVLLAFVYTPLISYVTARLEGTVGQALAIPFVREASIILSGYKGLAVWFLRVLPAGRIDRHPIHVQMEGRSPRGAIYHHLLDYVCPTHLVNGPNPVEFVSVRGNDVALESEDRRADVLRNIGWLFPVPGSIPANRNRNRAGVGTLPVRHPDVAPGAHIAHVWSGARAKPDDPAHAGAAVLRRIAGPVLL